MDLNNKVALVTGAGGGIGKAIVLKFAQAGALVGVSDLNFAAASKVADEIQTTGGKAIAITMDVTNEQQVFIGVEKLVNTFGSIDILVSNAGIQHIEAVHELSLANWRKVMNVHLDAAFLTTRSCLQQMYTQGKGGSIIYMGSVHSKLASVLKAPYVAAKHGILGLCRVVAKEGAKHGVRANVICPGFVRTPLVDKQIPQQAKELNISEEDVIKKIMLKDTVDGEFTTLADVAETATFLASFNSNALTGQSIVVSHGWYCN